MPTDTNTEPTTSTTPEQVNEHDRERSECSRAERVCSVPLDDSLGLGAYESGPDQARSDALARTAAPEVNAERPTSAENGPPLAGTRWGVTRVHSNRERRF